MKSAYSLLRNAIASFAVLSVVWMNGAVAAPLFTLEGQANGARYESDAGLRVSVLGWAGQEQADAVLEAYNAYQENSDPEALQEALQSQETLGYLFTQAATGYTIKYAWQDEAAGSMVFLVTPALKTRSPVLWETPNQDPAPFTLVELHWDGDQAVMKSSLDSGIAVEHGRLQLESFEQAEAFATLEDSTPYYLRQQS